MTSYQWFAIMLVGSAAYLYARKLWRNRGKNQLHWTKKKK